jgi:peptidoglycan/LPS O-acetylase OafA/YrhL
MRPRPLRARVTGLDGIRALAVAAVVAYHLDDRALPGGFLGVDVFFVLSGYLITTLLLDEWDATGTISLPGFWRRRARRLLPPLAVTLATVAAVAPLVFDDVVPRLRGELVAAVAQGSNWFEAFAGHSYFDAFGRPAPLQHLWSLGVEAQLYLLWPLLALAVLRRRPRALGWVAGVAAGASFLVLGLGFDPGRDPSRLYYGTDTRAGTVLVGAVLAVVLRSGRRRPVLADVGGAGALVGLVVLAFRLEGWSADAYRGGLLTAALLAAVVVAAVAHPGSRLGRVLSARPLLWLGTRSYAVYLWHWPVLTATRPGVDIALHGWVLLGLRLGLVALLAELTTRIVSAQWPRHVRRARPAGVSIGVATAMAAAFLVVLQAPSPAPVLASSPTTTTLPARPTTTAPSLPLATTTSGPAPGGSPSPVVAPSSIVVAPPGPSATPMVGAVVVGESVLLAAGGEVQRALGPGTVVDAAVARQPDDVLDALARARQSGQLGGVRVVVVQMGTNGVVRSHQLERLARLVAGVPRVVAVTVHVDRPWGEPSNAALRDAAHRYPWLRLADWHGVARDHPEWFGRDGVHPTRAGARHYAALVVAAASA